MAKKASARKGAAKYENPDEVRDDSFLATLAAVGQSLGKDIDPENLKARMTGLPVPSLCLRYLLQVSVFPLSKIIQITGEEGSCKSSLMFEFMRWHHVFGGGSVFLDNENKDSPALRLGLLDWNPAYVRRHVRHPTYSLEDWQEGLTRFVRASEAQHKLLAARGQGMPMCFGIDSIMATATREQLEKTGERGFASRDFPVAALLISNYMRTTCEMMKDYPFTIIGTNHLKPSTDYAGRPVKSSPGGKSVKFYESLEIEMARAERPDIDRVDEGGIRLRLTSRKSAYGQSRRQITAELLWHMDDRDGIMRQRFGWDWHTATTELLLSFEKVKGKKTLYDRLMGILPIRPVSRTTRRAACAPLGFTKENPGTYRQIGYELEQRQDLLEQLYPLLGITEHNVYQAGVTYQSGLSPEQALARSLNPALLYGAMDDLPLLNADALDPHGTVVPPIAPDEEGAESEYDGQ